MNTRDKKQGELKAFGPNGTLAYSDTPWHMVTVSSGLTNYVNAMNASNRPAITLAKRYKEAKQKSHEIADWLLEMTENGSIGHWDTDGSGTFAFLEESDAIAFSLFVGEEVKYRKNF